MTVTQEDLVKAVHNLNTLTRDRTIKWDECDSPIARTNMLLAITTVQKSYCSSYHGKTLRLTEISSAAPSLENALGARASRRQYSLEILDNDGTVIYKFPDVQGIADLFQSVK